MARHGLSEDEGDDPLASGRWRGKVASATRGKRGQAFFRRLVASLEAMPEKRLIAHQLVEDGDVCAIGSVIRDTPGIEEIDPEDYERIAGLVDISPCLVQEVEWINDEDAPDDPERRWQRVHNWATKQLRKTEAEQPAA